MLSDILRPRICELGKIKIGGKGESRQKRDGGTYRLPVKYDHFIVTTLNRANDELVIDAELMNSLKGNADKDGKLRALPCAVLSNEIEDIIQASWVWYNGKKVCGRSEDGKRATLFWDTKKNVWLEKPVEVDFDPDWAKPDANGNRNWKIHTTLNVVLAAAEARWGGVYKFRTTSQITADQLYGSLFLLKQLTGGVLRGLPLNLVVRPLQVTPQGKATTVYVVHLELRGPDLQAIQEQALERLKFEASNAKAMQQARIEYRQVISSPGENETDDETADIEDEFHAELPPDPPTGPDPLASQLGLNAEPPKPEEPPTESVASGRDEATEQEQVEREPGDDEGLPDEGEPPPEAKLPLPKVRQDEILGELHRLKRAWHDEKTKVWASGIIGRQIGASDHLSTLTESEASVLISQLVKFSPQKAGAK